MTIPGTNSSVQFVLIDTIILAGTTDPVDRSIPPKGPLSVTQANQQWAWINETLQSSKADWIIVAGHYPGGLDGSSDGYSGGRPLCYFCSPCSVVRLPPRSNPSAGRSTEAGVNGLQCLSVRDVSTHHIFLDSHVCVSHTLKILQVLLWPRPQHAIHPGVHQSRELLCDRGGAPN